MSEPLGEPAVDWREQRARLLGVAVGQQFHRALQVGEEYGDEFAFSLKRRFGRQDLLGEVGMTSGGAEGEGKVDSTQSRCHWRSLVMRWPPRLFLAQFPNVATGCQFSVQPCGNSSGSGSRQSGPKHFDRP